jgi:hypothetical protein
MQQGRDPSCASQILARTGQAAALVFRFLQHFPDMEIAEIEIWPSLGLGSLPRLQQQMQQLQAFQPDRKRSSSTV